MADRYSRLHFSKQPINAIHPREQSRPVERQLAAHASFLPSARASRDSSSGRAVKLGHGHPESQQRLASPGYGFPWSISSWPHPLHTVIAVIFHLPPPWGGLVRALSEHGRLGRP